MEPASILIVEDEITLARELEMRLTALGHTVSGIASSGEEAVHLAETTVPDLILMDIALKGDMDGIEAAAAIRAQRAVPVIFVAAFADTAMLERARVAETYGYMVKPFSERELHVNVAMALYRHRAETRIQSLERWFLTALEEVADAIIATDRAGTITMFNTAAEAITDWSREEALGAKFEDVFRLIDLEGNPIPLEDAADGPVVRMAADARLLDRAGHEIPLDSTTSAVRDATGNVTGTVTLFRDATGLRHGALSALGRDIALTGQALTLDGMLRLCTDALVRHVNAALARIWMLDADGTTLTLAASSGVTRDLDGPQSRVAVGSHKIGLVAQDRRSITTNDLTHDPIPDVERINDEELVAFAGFPLLVGDRLIGVVAIYARRPISTHVVEGLRLIAHTIAAAIDSKQAEAGLREALRNTLEQLSYVTASSPAILYTLTPDASGRLVPAWVSDNVTALLGYSMSEALEPSWFYSNLHPDDVALAAASEASVRDNGIGEAEYRFFRKDGSMIWIRDHARGVVNAQGELQRVGAWLDVTQRHAVEEQLLQSQKMESVGRLAGGVAHDFNNILTVITATADLLLPQCEGNSTAIADVAEVRRAAERASVLTRQLLAFSRKQIFQPRVLDLNTVVAGMEQMIRRLIRDDVTLSTSLASDLWNVRADAGQLEQIILNLVVNSRDAMPDGGHLTIETANALLDHDYAVNHLGVVAGPYVMLAVSDTGTGMEESVREHLFEPFFTTKAAGQGTGLGLSTVYGIVKQSGGEIWVYSELGIGTTFKVYLPRVESAPEEPPVETPQAAVAGGSETILLVEDEPDLRRLITRILARSGYRVLTCATAAEALSTAESDEGSIHLLLTDVVMPGMQGPELGRRIAALSPETRILYMSGYTEDAIMHRGALDGVAHFLSKPFDLETLTRTVRGVLDMG